MVQNIISALGQSPTNIVPPRPASDARREGRAAFDWRLVTLVLLLTAAAFVITLSSSDRSLSWWAWLIGSGVFLWDLCVDRLPEAQGSNELTARLHCWSTTQAHEWVATNLAFRKRGTSGAEHAHFGSGS
jgi:hypothetical protein